jgi:hypothetical protein
MYHINMQISQELDSSFSIFHTIILVGNMAYVRNSQIKLYDARP